MYYILKIDILYFNIMANKKQPVSIKRINHDDNMEKEHETIRTKGVNLMKKYLSKYLSEQEILKLESATYNSTISSMPQNKGLNFPTLYNNSMKYVTYNLSPDSEIKNTNLIKRVKSGEVNLCDIPNMKPMDIFPEKWHLQNKKREAEVLHSALGAQTIKSSLISCPSCHGPTVYNEEQTRSADEAMTIKGYCEKCDLSFID